MYEVGEWCPKTSDSNEREESMIRRENQQMPSLSEVIRILSVSPYSDDHSTLDLILRESAGENSLTSTWELARASTLSSALSLLRRLPCRVAICERDLPLGSWKDLLEYAQLLSNPPRIIVASRIADEYLWAEALNLGAHDVLAKPFDRKEALHVINSASIEWWHQYGSNIPAAQRMRIPHDSNRAVLLDSNRDF
jgi:DNA-binding NarL/FixJ family response regulator